MIEGNNAEHAEAEDDNISMAPIKLEIGANENTLVDFVKLENIHQVEMDEEEDEPEDSSTGTIIKGGNENTLVDYVDHKNVQPFAMDEGEEDKLAGNLTENKQ